MGKRSRRILLLALIIVAQPERDLLIVGLSIAAAAELLIILCYGMLDREDEKILVTRGPFAFMRNPVYFGYMAGAIGFTVAAGLDPYAIALGAIYLAIAIPHYLIRIVREERKLAQQFGDEFASYRRCVRWRLVPSPLSGLLNGGFRLSWSPRLALRNRAVAKSGKALLWMLIFIAKWELLSEWYRRDSFSPWTNPRLPWLLVAFAVSIAIMVVVPKVRRRVKFSEAA